MLNVLEGAPSIMPTASASGPCREEGDMAAAAEHEVAVYFVAHHHHSGFAGYGCEFGQCVGVPLYSYGVVWVAEHHHLGLVLGHHAAQAVDIHTVALAVEYERVFDYFAIVSFDNGAEGVYTGG